MFFNEWREKMGNTPAGGEVVLSLQGAHTDAKTHQCYSTVTLFCQNLCCCSLYALTFTNITLSPVYSLFRRKKNYLLWLFWFSINADQTNFCPCLSPPSPSCLPC